jgi:DNA mismatch endonuclease (patch repair protein)
MPKTRPAFWAAKLGANVSRDKIATRALQELGWNVLIVWECELEKIDRLERKLQRSIAGGVK